MVNKHFSLGCHRCRARHTRCDETKPQCLKCTSKGIECPGYRDVNGFLFVDQSEKVAKRRAKLSKKKDPTAAAEAEAKEKKSEEEARSESVKKALSSPQPRIDPGQASVAFFFRTYLQAGRNPLTSRGHFDYLLPMYTSAKPSSLLCLAMEVVAGRAMALNYRRSIESPWHTKTLVCASEAMRSAISDWNECLTDETLLATLLLDFADWVKSRRTNVAQTYVHQTAARGLVRMRGQANFQSEMAWSLYHATRSNAVRGAIDDSKAGIGTLEIMDVSSPLSNPAIKLDGLISRALYVRGIVEKLPGSSSSDVLKGEKGVENFAEDLHRDLLSWRDNLPAQWHPQVEDGPHATDPCFAGLWSLEDDMAPREVYSSSDVAFIYNQWRCTRLLVLAVLRWCRSRNSTPSTSEGDEQEEDDGASGMLSSLCAAVPYFLHGGGRISLHFYNDHGSTKPHCKDQKCSELGAWYLMQILDWSLAILESRFGRNTLTDAGADQIAALNNLSDALKVRLKVTPQG